MIRKRKRRISNPFKPNYQTRRERKRIEYAEQRPIVRQQAWDRDKGRCQFPTCRRYVTLDAAHIHEVKWRGRGGSATDLANTMTLCGCCHEQVHPRVGGVLKRIEATADGGRRFFERETGRSPWIEVTERAA